MSGAQELTGSTWRRRIARLIGVRSGGGRSGDQAGATAVIAVIAALTPIIVSAVRTAIRGWVPIGDNGLLLLRSADVATDNHPWLGTWTSASLTAGKNFNNPGPLLFDLLAIPVKALGYGVGIPIGMAIINGGAVVGAALVARRQAGPHAIVAVMAAAAGLAWGMGSELLVDPWQPHSMMLPFFLLAVVVWGIFCGDLKLVVWFVAVSSLLVQTHVSYSFLVLFFAAGAAAAVVFHARRSPQNRVDLRPIGFMAGVAALVLWVQPLLEQFFGDGDGNLSRLLSSSSSDQPTIGLRLGTRLIADVMVLPPWFARWNFIGAVPATPYTGTGADKRLFVDGVTPFSVAAVAVFLFLVAVALFLWRAVRIRHRVVVASLGMVVWLLACAAASMILMPSGVLGLSPHQMRWLWTMSAFNLAAIAASAVVLFAQWSASRPRRANTAKSITRAGVRAGAAAAVLFAAFGAQTFTQAAGPTADHAARDSIVELMRQMFVLEGSGPLLFDDADLRFAEPYSGAVMARLGELDVPFEVERVALQRQVGNGRAISGRAIARLYLREGQDAVATPDGVDRVAFVPGLTSAEQAELAALTDVWSARLADGLPSLDPEQPGLSHDEVAELLRLQDLESRWRFLTVGLFLAPIGP
ncbi:MAG: hypothetical protein ABIW84_02250 [Ilumatobacteraceae bacterium]